MRMILNVQSLSHLVCQIGRGALFSYHRFLPQGLPHRFLLRPTGNFMFSWYLYEGLEERRLFI